MSDVPQEIERILRARFAPSHLALRDDSARHVGHAGATSGGGHYRVTIVSAAFEGLSLLDRHRRVNEALRDLFGARIHALGLETLTPAEWDEKPPG
jgi:BolA protein